MSNGELNRDRKCAHPIGYRPCVDRCPTCSGEWHKSFLTVDRDKVVQFLRHIDRKKMPWLAKADNVVDLLWSDKHKKWRIKDIFRKTKVPKYNVDALFLQLIASKMIILTAHQGVLTWTVGERVLPNTGRDFILTCEETSSWEGINVFEVA